MAASLELIPEAVGVADGADAHAEPAVDGHFPAQAVHHLDQVRRQRGKPRNEYKKHVVDIMHVKSCLGASLFL